MSTKKFTLILIAAVFATGCATRGAAYVPLVDMKGVDQSTLATNVKECQDYAKTKATAAQAAVTVAIFGALIGAALSPSGYRGTGATYGAALGGVSGAGSAMETQEVIVKRCVAGRGFSVLN